MRQMCPTHGKPFPCGPCRIESKSKPPQTPSAPTSIPAVVKADVLPETVRVHSCRYPEMKPCKCRKKASYDDALEMIRHGEASWVQLVVPVGPPKEINTAVKLTLHDRARRGRSVGAPMIEDCAEVGLAKLRNRLPDLNDPDSVDSEESAEKRSILASKGGSIGGRILKTTRTRLRGDGREFEEGIGTFDGEITRMGKCGPKGGDRTGGQTTCDDYSDESPA